MMKWTNASHYAGNHVGMNGHGHKGMITDHKVGAKTSRLKKIIKMILKITGVLDT